ncbi:MAG: glycosyltransferase family 2 protein [Acidobacteriota bacterium]|nr:glycosyltransferase family 2 protein [Acidobacteriota bacterium]
MKLLIAIPALDEEESIASIIERCLAAAPEIVEKTAVTEVEITVVSDGSTDATVAIARGYTDRIRLIEFEVNRGYGAAILEAWKTSDAELLSFLDADGTCDPRFFVDLCRTLEEEGAEIALGCRLHRESKMPPVRRLGNRLFGTLLSLVSSQSVRDTASGMRVVRRSALPKLMPLPSGLHFTPAMSARALLRRDVVIREINMPYDERQGQSKLKVFRDGLRFLAIILETVFLFRPSRPLGFASLAALGLGGLLMLTPILHYLATHTVEEWMIYRFVVSHLLGTIGVLALCTAYLSRRVVTVTVLPHRKDSWAYRLLRAFFTGAGLRVAVPVLVVAGSALVLPGLLQWIERGSVYEHWSRFIATSFLFSAAAILVVTRVMDFSLDLIQGWMAYEGRRSESP